MSILYNDDRIDEITRDDAKPEIINFRNLTRGRVDVVNVIKALYLVVRISCWGPLPLFSI